MKNSEGEEPLKYCSSGKHIVILDNIDCCMACIRRAKRGKRSPKKKRKKFKE